MKSVFLIAIVAVAMIGVMVPSVFAQSDHPNLIVSNNFIYSDHFSVIISPVVLGESIVVSAKILGTITPIIATATIAKMNTDFNIIFKCSEYL